MGTVHHTFKSRRFIHFYSRMYLVENPTERITLQYKAQRKVGDSKPGAKSYQFVLQLKRFNYVYKFLLYTRLLIFLGKHL